MEDGAAVDAVPPLPSLLPQPDDAQKRADVLALKLRLAALLPPAEGQRYWSSLVGFMQGKINRDELGQHIKRTLGEKGEAVQLHNALLLSILYNTTRASLPPATLRHSGWHKRKRDKDGSKVPERDPKRRKVKATVMAIGKRERAELKMLGLAPRKESEREKLKAREKEEAKQRSIGATLDSRGTHLGKDGLPLALADAKQPSATLPQDYMRCLQTPLCCESRLLPDVDSLKDRMSLIAYDSGLAGGAESKAAALGVQALETHLKSMISSVISLIRTNRSNGISTPTSDQLALLAAAAAPEHGSQPTDSASDGKTTLPADSICASGLLAADSALPDPPIDTEDFAALFEISPSLLVQPHVGAVERLYAIPPPSDSEESQDSSSESEDEEGDQPMREAQQLGGKKPKLTRSASGPRSARGPSRSNSMISNGGSAGTTGREQYLIDPTAIAIPTGHPDVAHPRIAESRSATGGTPRLTNGGAGSNGTATPNAIGTPQMSPKALSLRQQLFPEFEHDTAGNGGGDASLQAPASPNNNTSTDGGGSDSEDGAAGRANGATGGVAAGRPGRPRTTGRKLWEVVDSVRLLDGVL